MNAIATQFPELPTPAAVLERTWRATWFVGESKLDHCIEKHAVYTADQMHQYARDYAATLSQTAGVPAKWEVRHRFWDGAPWGPWESYETEAERTESFAKFKGSEWLHETRELYAAAPAASGGEDDRSGWCRSDGCAHKKFGEPIWKTGDNPFQSSRHPDVLQDGTLSKSTAKRVEALAAASVSERARELLATECGVSPEMVDEYQDRDVIVRLALRAIEQALTQQRGAASYDAGMAMHWIERYAAGIDEECQLDRIAEAFTTPQPSADAVREVIGSMRNFADVADKCELTEGNAQVAIRAWATQLESLLSAASGEKGVASA